MGQVHLDHVALEDAVHSSNLIVVATPTGSEEVREPVEDETHDGQAAPDFRWHRREFEVREVVSGDDSWVGKSIGVVPADLDWDRDLHRRYYVDGISMSPIKRWYPAPDFPGDAPRILFLNEESGRVQFAIAGAEESIERLGEVKALAPSGGSLVPFADYGRAATPRDLVALRRSIDIYIAITLFVAAMFVFLAVVVGGLWLHGGLAASSVIAALVTLNARRKLTRRKHDATQWVSFALMTALPVAVLGASYGAFFFLLGLLSAIESSINYARILAIVCGFVGATGGFYNTWLLWVISRTDFDQLLWESEASHKALDDSLNYLE